MSISILCCSSCCKRGSSYCKLGSSYCKLGSSYYKSAPPTLNSGPPTVNSSPPSVKVYSRRSLVNSRRSRVYSRRSMLTVGGTPKHGRVSPLGAFIFSICVSYNLSEKTGPKINTETLWTSWAQKMKKKIVLQNNCTDIERWVIWWEKKRTSRSFKVSNWDILELRSHYEIRTFILLNIKQFRRSLLKFT